MAVATQVRNIESALKAVTMKKSTKGVPAPKREPVKVKGLYKLPGCPECGGKLVLSQDGFSDVECGSRAQNKCSFALSLTDTGTERYLYNTRVDPMKADMAKLAEVMRVIGQVKRSTGYTLRDVVRRVTATDAREDPLYKYRKLWKMDNAKMKEIVLSSGRESEICRYFNIPRAVLRELQAHKDHILTLP